MKSHHRVNVILLLVAFGALILLLTAAACAPINSPYIWAYEYENAQKETAMTSQTTQGKNLVDQENYDEAIRKLDVVIKKYPTAENVYFWRGRAYYGKKDYDKALEDFNRHILQQPYDPYGFNLRGNVYSALERHDDAITDYTSAIKKRPTALFYYLRANEYEKIGQLDKAIVDYTSSLGASQNSDMARILGADWEGDILWKRGSLLQKEGHIKAAKEDARKTLEANPKRKAAFSEENLLDYFDLDKRKRVADTAIDAAKNAETGGNYLTAFREYKKAYAWGADDNTSLIADMQDIYARLNPKPRLAEEVRRYGVQAETATADKKYDTAIGLYKRALEIEPCWPQGYFNMAAIMADRSNFKGAIEKMKMYIKLAPNASDARIAQDSIYQWEYKLKSASR